ncbi:MAG: phosphatidate cytidylyltransferase [Burkholderiaceae bacterium]
MLKQRIITAIVLLLILLPALFYSDPTLFFAITLVLLAGGAWEWGRLNGLGPVSSVLLGALSMLLCAAAWGLGWHKQTLPVLWQLSAAFWVLAAAWLLRGGAVAWAQLPPSLRLVSGVFVLWLSWLALAQARLVGVNFLLSIMTLVWVADISAYFAGKRWGGRFFSRKLAPAISPGKSWEGVAGGLVGVLILAVTWHLLDGFASVPSFYTLLITRGWWFFLLAVTFMLAMSVVGDLVESLIKRSAGVKDSSQLLPGHGGVLDRVDALLPTLPLAMMLHSMTTW